MHQDRADGGEDTLEMVDTPWSTLSCGGEVMCSCGTALLMTKVLGNSWKEIASLRTLERENVSWWYRKEKWKIYLGKSIPRCTRGSSSEHLAFVFKSEPLEFVGLHVCQALEELVLQGQVGGWSCGGLGRCGWRRSRVWVWNVFICNCSEDWQTSQLSQICAPVLVVLAVCR